MFIRVRYDWEERIERAEALREEHPFTRAYLNFYILLAGHQKQLYETMARRIPLQDLTWRGDPPLRSPFFMDHLKILLEIYPEFLQFVADCGTALLVDHARALQNGTGPERWQTLLMAYWDGQVEYFANEPVLIFFTKVFLQPYAELLAEAYYRPLDESGLEWTVAQGGDARCPLCGHRPQLSVMRSEGEGAKRMLLCSLCGTEWRFKRVCCPYCGEEHNERLAYHRSETFPHIRIDVCEACQQYLKAVDLTQDGRAVPVVDDLASIPLDIWAVENGYRKPEVNLIGV